MVRKTKTIMKQLQWCVAKFCMHNSPCSQERNRAHSAFVYLHEIQCTATCRGSLLSLQYGTRAVKTKLNIVPFSFFLILDVGQPIAVSLHQLPMLCNEVDHGDIPSCRNNALGQERLWSSGHG